MELWHHLETDQAGCHKITIASFLSRGYLPICKHYITLETPLCIYFHVLPNHISNEKALKLFRNFSISLNACACLCVLCFPTCGATLQIERSPLWESQSKSNHKSSYRILCLRAASAVSHAVNAGVVCERF